MTVAVVRAHAASLPLPAASVDLIVTSPPYFGLRSYTDACDQCGGEGRAPRPDSHGVKFCPNGCESTGRKRCHYCGAAMKWPKRAAAQPTDCLACGGTGQRHYPGQIGSEGTPAEWLEALQACTAEWVRVLKPEGSLFVNLGDKYSDRGHGPNQGNGTGCGPQNTLLRQTRGPMEKSLLGLPWRYAIGCVDRLGLILRAEIVWAKPNGLPESVTDRVRRSHEQIFHMVKQPRYYSAVDEIREQYAPETKARYAAGYNPRKIDGQRLGIGTNLGGDTYGENPLGKLPGSVWSIPSQPLQVPAHLGVDHFAAFPMELPRRLVLGWSPPGVCVGCGQGRRPIVDKRFTALRGYATGKPRLRNSTRTDDQSGFNGDGLMGATEATITGYACTCWPGEGDGRTADLRTADLRMADVSALGGLHMPLDVERLGPLGEDGRRRLSAPPTRPAVVLDPFGGTGTTALVASVLGRHGITADLSADYGRLARWRVNDPGERARAMEVPKPPKQVDGQDALFEVP